METMEIAANNMMMCIFLEEDGKVDSKQIQILWAVWWKKDDSDMISSDHSCGSEWESDELLFGLPVIAGVLEEIYISSTLPQNYLYRKFFPFTRKLYLPSKYLNNSFYKSES